MSGQHSAVDERERFWRDFQAVFNALGTLIKVDMHQLHAVCAGNCRPGGDRAAIVEVFLQQIDTLGAAISAGAPNVGIAESLGERLDSTRERLINTYASQLRTLEHYFPGLTEELKVRLFGRTEHWKAAALLNGLAAETAAPVPTIPLPEGSTATTGAAVGPVPATHGATPEDTPPLSAGTKPQAKRPRGPGADSDGHRRVAELLRDDWADDISASLRCLDSPPDGGPRVCPSASWCRNHGITTYTEANEAIGNREIKKHINRRRALGQQ